MDLIPLEAKLGLGAQILSILLDTYVAFQRTNVERFFKRLVESDEDLSRIANSEELQRYLFQIIDRVSHEANLEKIESWKNAVISLATDFHDFDFRDNFIQTLDNLTPFDLTVLYTIYHSAFPKGYFQAENVASLIFKDIPELYTDMVMQSVKRLASHNLITEQYDQSALFGRDDGEPLLHGMHYTKNRLGVDFLEFTKRYPSETLEDDK